MLLTVGARLQSAAGDTQVLVIRAPATPVDVTCGGHPLVPIGTQPTPGLAVAAGHDGGAVLGKRYADEDSGLELLCTKAGAAALFLDGSRLPVKAAKSLPASD